MVNHAEVFYYTILRGTNVLLLFFIYNITYLLKSRKEHEKDKLVYVS